MTAIMDAPLHVVIAVWVLRRVGGRHGGVKVVSASQQMKELDKEVAATKADDLPLAGRLALSIIERYMDRIEPLEKLGEIIVVSKDKEE